MVFLSFKIKWNSLYLNFVSKIHSSCLLYTLQFITIIFSKILNKSYNHFLFEKTKVTLRFPL